MIVALYEDEASIQDRITEISTWPIHYPAASLTPQAAYLSIILINNRPLSVLQPEQVYKFRITAAHILWTKQSEVSPVTCPLYSRTSYTFFTSCQTTTWMIYRDGDTPGVIASGARLNQRTQDAPRTLVEIQSVPTMSTSPIHLYQHQYQSPSPQEKDLARRNES